MRIKFAPEKNIEFRLKTKNLKSITIQGLWILLYENRPDLLCHVSNMYASTHRHKQTLGDFEKKPSKSAFKKSLVDVRRKTYSLPHFLLDVQPRTHPV